MKARLGKSRAIAVLGPILIGCGYWFALSLPFEYVAAPYFGAVEQSLRFAVLPGVRHQLAIMALFAIGCWLVCVTFLSSRSVKLAWLAWGAMYFTLMGYFLLTGREMGLFTFTLSNSLDLTYHSLTTLGAVLLLETLLRPRQPWDLAAWAACVVLEAVLNSLLSWDGPMLLILPQAVFTILVWPTTGIALMVAQVAVAVRTITPLVRETRAWLAARPT